MERALDYEEREREAHAGGEAPEAFPEEEAGAPLTCTYRHGDGSAEVIAAELLDASGRPAEVVESGAQLTVRVRVRFHADLEEPVVGFLIRNRHSIHAYGTNTNEQQLTLGPFKRGEAVEVSFAFGCWLGLDHFSVSLAVHSRIGEAYDWLDGVIFFRVVSPHVIEGVANLNASATARRIGVPAAESKVAAAAE
jgi:hypothetical protein